MTNIDAINPLDDRFIDLIVEGEMSPAELRAAIDRLDGQPDGWKRCAGVSGSQVLARFIPIVATGGTTTAGVPIRIFTGRYSNPQWPSVDTRSDRGGRHRGLIRSGLGGPRSQAVGGRRRDCYGSWRSKCILTGEWIPP